MRTVIVLFAVALCVPVCAGASAPQLPNGWRLPSKAELSGDDERKDSPSRYARAAADLNGDGIIDEAFLLKSTRFPGEALWVSLSGQSRDFKWHKLQEIRYKQGQYIDLSMAIDIQQPGVVPYACFDNADACNFGEDVDRPKLNLKDPALIYFRLGSAASMYFWSTKHTRFMKVWLSD